MILRGSVSNDRSGGPGGLWCTVAVAVAIQKRSVGLAQL
jgi:hypothetical protein